MPQGSFLTGHFNVFASKRAFRKLAEWSNVYGPIYRVRVLHINMVVLSDPEDFLPLIAKPSVYLDKQLQTYAAMNMMNEGGLGSILTSPTSDYWRSIRKAVAPAFSVSNMKRLFPSLLSLCRSVVGTLNEYTPNQVVDMAALARRMTSSVIESIISGEEMKWSALGEDLMVQMITDTTEAMSNFVEDPFLWVKLWSPKLHWSREKLKIQQAVNKDFVKRIMACQPPLSSIAGCLGTVRLADTGLPLSPQQYVAEVGLIQLAGFETTAYAIAWALFLVATHPQVEEKITAELDSKGLLVRAGQSQPDTPLAWQHLGELIYLNAVIKESLRLMPTAPFGTSRVAEKDVTIRGHTIPKGTSFIISPYVHGHSKRIWGDTAEDFRPERWLGDGKNSSSISTAEDDMDGPALGGGASLNMSHVYAFMAGPRDCVGQSLAKLELQVVLATLWSNFHFDLAPEMGDVDQVRQGMSAKLTLQSDCGMKMTCRSRRG